MANITAVTDNMLPVANETFIDNLSAGISAGAAIVPMNSLSEYADGDSVVLTVDPGTAKQATFIGEKQGNQVIDCKWTEGNVGVSHDAGATVIDYDSSTHYNVLRKAVQQHTNENGTLKTTAVQAALNISSAVPADWTPLANVPSVTSVLGRREQVLTYTGIDYTDRLQAGSKLRIPRTVAVATQSMQFLSASTQSAFKATPAGMTFVDDFSAEAWIYVDSYTATEQWIINRISAGGVDGWGFDINQYGQVGLRGIKSGSSDRRVRSYVGVPQGRWVHVAATLDMTANTGTVYIDGELVASAMSGTNNTGLTQPGTTNLVVGQFATGGYGNVNMKIAHLRVWSTIRTASDIRNNMYQDTLASTAGLVVWYKGAGSWNDSSSNANHLTPVNGAINNFASYPFSAIEFAVVKSAVLTTGNTEVTVTVNAGGIPSETLGSTSYSSVYNPYGFPLRKFDSVANGQDYSLSEIDTGNTWFDGRKIYKATILHYHAGGGTEVAVNLNIPPSATNIVKVEGGQQTGSYLGTGGDFYPIEYMNPGATTLQNAQLKVSLVGTVWQMRFNSGSAGTFYVTVYYTK